MDKRQFVERLMVSIYPFEYHVFAHIQARYLIIFFVEKNAIAMLTKTAIRVEAKPGMKPLAGTERTNGLDIANRTKSAQNRGGQQEVKSLNDKLGLLEHLRARKAPRSEDDDIDDDGDGHTLRSDNASLIRPQLHSGGLLRNHSARGYAAC